MAVFFNIVFFLLFAFINSLYAESYIKNIPITISEEILYNLQGEWKAKFEDVKNGEALSLDDSNWMSLTVPGFWALKGIYHKGIAWHRLHIKISSKLKGQKLALQIPNILDAHKAYFNENLIGSSGKVDPTYKDFQYNAKSNFYIIEPDTIRYDQDNLISIQIQNRYSIGGTFGNVYFGTLPLVTENFLFFIISRLVLFSCFIILSVFIFFFYFGFREINSVYASLHFLSASCFTLSIDRIDSWLVNDGFTIFYILFTFGFGGIYLFQFLLLKNEYGYQFYQWEKKIVVIYLLFFVANFFPIFYQPLFEIRNKASIPIFSAFHFMFIIHAFYYSVKVLIDKKFGNYPYALGCIFAFPFMMNDYLLSFNLKKFHIINSENSLLIISVFYFINLILKQNALNRKLLTIEKKHSEELEQKIVQKTQELLLFNEELTKSNQLKNKLLSIISHDLRSPLNALTQVIHLFKDKDIDKKQLHKHIIDLSEILDRNRFLLENLLNWSYVQFKSELLSTEKLNLIVLLNNIYDIMMPAALQKSIQLDLSIVIPECFVISNSHVLNVVLINLLNNSIKFTELGGKIELGLLPEAELITIYVKDNGIGMDIGTLEMIEQGKEVHPQLGTQDEKGAGIGLKLCKDFLNKLNIPLNILSSPQKGTTVFFSIRKYIK